MQWLHALRVIGATQLRGVSPASSELTSLACHKRRVSTRLTVGWFSAMSASYRQRRILSAQQCFYIRPSESLVSNEGCGAKLWMCNREHCLNFKEPNCEKKGKESCPPGIRTCISAKQPSHCTKPLNHKDWVMGTEITGSIYARGNHFMLNLAVYLFDYSISSCLAGHLWNNVSSF